MATKAKAVVATRKVVVRSVVQVLVVESLGEVIEKPQESSKSANAT